MCRQIKFDFLAYFPAYYFYLPSSLTNLNTVGKQTRAQ